MKTFTDLFSQQSDIYAQYRPHYPQQLFDYLASLTSGHELAWDCGTGNGQAAVCLAALYNQVLATDPSEQQLKHATQHPKVLYKIQKS